MCEFCSPTPGTHCCVCDSVTPFPYGEKAETGVTTVKPVNRVKAFLDKQPKPRFNGLQCILKTRFILGWTVFCCITPDGLRGDVLVKGDYRKTKPARLVAAIRFMLECGSEHIKVRIK